jgi:hypothetical protein
MGRRLTVGLRFSFAVALVTLAACTESHDVEETPSGTEEGGSGGSSPRAGSGGAGGTSNAGRGGTAAPRAGSGGSAVAPVECGGTSCMGNALLPGCCTSDDKCGLNLASFGVGTGCSEMNAPGTANASCPGMSFMGFVQLEGCCRPDGTCGVLDTFTGLGCAQLGASEMRCEP